MEKVKLSKNDKMIITAAIVIGLIVLVVAFSVIFADLFAPKADYNGFKKALGTYISSNKDINEIEIVDNDVFDVRVNDSWFTSSEIQKLRFCNNVRDVIYTYAKQYNLIYKDSDYTYITFYDNTNIKLAEPDMLEFVILQ